MLWEATMVLLTLMWGMWAMAVWASFREDLNNEWRSASNDRKAAA